MRLIEEAIRLSKQEQEPEKTSKPDLEALSDSSGYDDPQAEQP